MEEWAAAAFLAAAGLHAGFQLTVSAVVYPTLAHVRPAHWRQAHDRHSRAITPLVAITYVALIATGAWWLALDQTALPVAAVALGVLAVLVTAAVAAPLHRKLVKRDDRLVARLLTVDRVRTVLAFGSAAVALVAVAR